MNVQLGFINVNLEVPLCSGTYFDLNECMGRQTWYYAHSPPAIFPLTLELEAWKGQPLGAQLGKVAPFLTSDTSAATIQYNGSNHLPNNRTIGGERPCQILSHSKTQSQWLNDRETLERHRSFGSDAYFCSLTPKWSASCLSSMYSDDAFPCSSTWVFRVARNESSNAAVKKRGPQKAFLEGHGTTPVRCTVVVY